MKKMLALLLACTLLLTLALPSAAAPAGGYKQGYEDGKRDKAEGKEPAWTNEDLGYISGYMFGYGADDYDLGNDDGFDAGQADAAAGREEQDFSTPETDYDEGYQDGYHYGYATWWYDSGYDAGFAAGQADREAGKEEQESPATETDNYDYALGFSTGYWDGYYGYGEDDEEDHIDSTLTDCGGTPGKINVRLNERCIDFGDVWPENRDGRTMAPVRAILEALGAEVDYDQASKTVTARVEETLLRHTIGARFIEVYPDGDLSQEPRHLEMDCASYVSGGRTMVPVRFFSQALGYYVDWDGYYKTVVLLDTQGLLASYEDQLTVLRLLLSDLQREAGTYRTVAELDAGVDILDSLHGDTHLDLGAKLEALLDEKAVNASVDLDLADILDFYLEEEGAGDYLEPYQKEVLDLCKQLHLEYIYNQETGKLYVKSPLFDHLNGWEAWVATDYGTELLAVGDPLEQYMLQDILVEDDWYYADPITAYDLATERMDDLVTAVGDENFEKSGNTYTLKADSPLVAALAEAMYELTYDYSDVDCAVQLLITDRGDGTCDYQGSLQYQDEELALQLDFRQQNGSGSVDCSVHVRNTCKVDFHLATKTTPADDPVRATPPTEPVDFEDIYV